MPNVAISAGFLDALASIPKAQQRKVRAFVTRFQGDPTSSGINYEPLRSARDPRVRSVRIDLAYRAIVLHPERGDTYVLVWVDHHDEAMAWAENKVFPVNPVTGALQVVDYGAVAVATTQAEPAPTPRPLAAYRLFNTFSDEDLLRTGLPEVLLPAVRYRVCPRNS